MKLIGLYDTMPTPTSTSEVLRVGKGCFYKVYKASQTKSGLEWKLVGVSSDNDLDNILWDDRVLGADEEFVVVPLDKDLLERMMKIKHDAEEAEKRMLTRYPDRDEQQNKMMMKTFSNKSVEDIKAAWEEAYPRLNITNPLTTKQDVVNPFSGEDMAKAFNTIEEVREKHKQRDWKSTSRKSVTTIDGEKLRGITIKSDDQIMDEIIEDIDNMSVEELTEALMNCGRDIHNMMHPVEKYEDYTPSFYTMKYKDE